MCGGITTGQARLMTLTARQHDLELRAQQISAKKMIMAMQSQQVATEYSDALNRNKMFQFKSANSSQAVAVTLKSLCSAGSKYELRNSSGQKAMPASEYKMYQALINSTTNPNSWGNRATAQKSNSANGDYFNAFMGAKYGNLVTLANQVFASEGLNWSNSDDYKEIVDKLDGHGGGMGTWQALVQYAADNGITNVNLPTMEEVNYYEAQFVDFTENATTVQANSNNGGAHTYSQITASNLNQFVVIEDSLVNNAGWLYEAVQSGQYTLTTTSGENVDLSEFSEKTDSEGIDRAQAKYDAETKKISAAEKRLDLELTQINTEHSAVTTEYDSVKSLISDNTDKSFNIFS